MTLDDGRGQHDPLTWLWTFVREVQRQAAATVSAFFQNHHRYRRLLGQALFPLLKRRLRNDDDEDEGRLRHTIFLAHGTLLAWIEQLSTPEATDVIAPRDQVLSFNHTLEQHLEKMETIILPAARARLSACDITLLARGMEQRDQRMHSPSTPPPHPPTGQSRNAR